MMSNIKNVLKANINPLILTLYLFIVWSSYLYITSFSSAVGLLILMIGALVVAFAVSKILFSVLSKVVFKEKSSTFIKRLITFLALTILSLSVMLLWYVAYYPGAFSPDTILQVVQATTGKYSDWHPFWHTIVFFTLPLKLTGNPNNIVLFQIIYFSLTMGYMGMVIYKHSNIRVALLSVIYVILNPYTGWVLLFPWKDSGFSIAGCLTLTMVVEIYYSKKWGNKLWRIVLLGIMLANTTLFRHNGILFTGVLLIALLFFLNKKQIIVLLVTFALFMTIIKVPVYRALDVEKPGSRVVETTGLPLTILGNVVKEAPDKLSQETLDFAYSISDPSNWYYIYQCGDFNSLKWYGYGINSEPIEEAGVGKMISITIECFTHAPKESFKALFTLTGILYNVEYAVGEEEPYITVNDLGITDQRNPELVNFLQSYKNLFNNSFLKYTRFTGVSVLAMAIAITMKSNFFSKKDWKRILICLSIFAYDFGTMLLLTGTDIRYFYITFLVAPLIVTLMFSEKKPQELID